jgi:hypothetical protein
MYIARSRYCGMAKKPEPPKPTIWTIYKIAVRQERLGTVEAADEATAMEKAAAEFGVSAKQQGGGKPRSADGDQAVIRPVS